MEGRLLPTIRSAARTRWKEETPATAKSARVSEPGDKTGSSSPPGFPPTHVGVQRLHTHLALLEDILAGRAPRPFWSNHAKAEADYEQRIES